MHRINKLLSELERQQRKKNKKRKQKQQKQKEREEEEINIIRTRANQSTFIDTEGKWRLKWNEIEIGTFLDPGQPRPL